MNAAEIINLISGIASLILSILAIWLSLYFYTKTKDTEKTTIEALASIKQQTDSLQKLTGKWMDRLTRYATESHPESGEVVSQLIGFVKEYPAQYVASLNIPQTNDQIEKLTSETISLYIALYYYTALGNYFAQGHLPKLEEFDQNSEVHALVKNSIDTSSSDFIHMQGIINRVDQARLNASPLNDILQKTEGFWKLYVKDSTGVFQNKESN